MTETTIPAAFAATDKQPSKLYTYWWSDDLVPCKAIYTLVPFDTVAYPLVDEAPDFAQLKNPKYNRVLHKWVEMDPEAQGAKFAAMQQTIDDLKKKNESLTEDNEKLEAQSSTNQKQIGELGTMFAAGMAKPKEPATVPNNNGTAINTNGGAE